MFYSYIPLTEVRNPYSEFTDKDHARYEVLRKIFHEHDLKGSIFVMSLGAFPALFLSLKGLDEQNLWLGLLSLIALIAGFVATMAYLQMSDRYSLTTIDSLLVPRSLSFDSVQSLSKNLMQLPMDERSSYKNLWNEILLSNNSLAKDGPNTHLEQHIKEASLIVEEIVAVRQQEFIEEWESERKTQQKASSQPHLVEEIKKSQELSTARKLLLNLKSR